MEFRGVTGRLEPYRCNLSSRVAIVDEQQVVRNHSFGLSCQQRDGRHAMPHPKLDDRVRLSSQFPQLVTVFESQPTIGIDRRLRRLRSTLQRQARPAAGSANR